MSPVVLPSIFLATITGIKLFNVFYLRFDTRNFAGIFLNVSCVGTHYRANVLLEAFSGFAELMKDFPGHSTWTDGKDGFGTSLLIF